METVNNPYLQQRKEQLALSEKVAKFYLDKGLTNKEFLKMSKDQVSLDFPEISNLKEISKKVYDIYIKEHDESTTYNLFQSLVNFNMAYYKKGE